jgi:hypothetical protein
MRALDILLFEYSQKKTIKQWGEKVAARLQQEAEEGNDYAKRLWDTVTKGAKTDEAKIHYAAKGVMDHIEKWDPTSDKKYSEWMARLYAKKGIEHIEDVEARLAEALRYHNRLARSNRIESQYKNIDKFKNIQQLEQFVDQYYGEDPEEAVQQMGAEAQKLLQNDQADLLYNGPDYQIVEPKSHKASCHFGSGTKWCTTMSTDNFWKQYSSLGDFYYVFDKNNRQKIAINFGAQEYRDPQDNWYGRYELMTKHAKVLKKIAEKKGQNELTQDPAFHVFFTPGDEQAQLAALPDPKAHGNRVDGRLKTVDGRLLMLMQNPSEQVISHGVWYDPELVLEIPEDWRSDEVMKAALERKPDLALFFKDVSIEAKEKAVRRSPKLIKRLEDPDPQLINAAVQSDASLLPEYEDQVTPETKNKAVSQNPDILAQLKEVTPEMINAAVPSAPELLPQFEDQVTEKSAIEALKKQPKTIDDLKRPTQKMINTAVGADPELLPSYENKVDEKAKESAIKKKPRVILDLKNPSDELKKVAISKDVKLLPKLFENPDEETVITAMQKEPVAIYKKYKDKFPNLLDKGLEANGSLIKFIPKPSPEQQMTAVKSNPNSYTFISNPTPEVVEYVRKKRPKLVRD